MKKLFFVLFSSMTFPFFALADSPVTKRVHSGWEAFTELTKGNERFQRGESTILKSWSKAARKAASGMSQPSAVVVTCSDSRFNPDILFDQPIGKLYVVRTAGLALDGASRGSIELAISRFDTSLVVFLGSENCLALHSAASHQDSSDAIDMNHMHLFLKQYAISPGLSPAAIQMKVQQNVRGAVTQFIESSRFVQKKIAAHKVLIAEARLDFLSGKVYFWKVGAPKLKNYKLAWESGR